MPRLSVLMPAHNAERFLGLAVSSTLTAMPKDSELIVLDDASTDRTLEILANVHDPRLRVIASASKSGVAGALGKLLSSTDSELVARMDADDVCLPWRFKLQALMVEKADFSFTTVGFLNSRGRLTHVDVSGSLSPAVVPLHLLIENILVHPTMFARRSAVESLGGYNHIPVEDYDLWLRAAAQGFKLHRSGIPSLLYRRHTTQTSASSAWRLSADEPILRDSYSRLIEKEFGFSAEPGSRDSWSTLGLFADLDPSNFERFKESFSARSIDLPIREKLGLAWRKSRHFGRTKC